MGDDNFQPEIEKDASGLDKHNKVVVGFDVAQTCSNQEGCAWHADALSRALSAISGKYQITLYHQFPPWFNSDCTTGTQIENIDSPFIPLSAENAMARWKQVAENDTNSLPGSPKILHSNSFSVPPKPRGTKLIYTIHDLSFWTHPQFVEEQNRLHCQGQVLSALKHADAYIFISQNSKNDFEDTFPNWLDSNRKPWKIISSGSRFPVKQSERFLPNKTTSDSSPWLYVGSIEPRKNIIGLLHAYKTYFERSELKRPLLIVGSAKTHSKNEIEAIEVARKTLPVSTLGYVNDDELKQLFQTSFALLYPSHYEGFGLPAIESMSFALPVIAQNIPSLMEIAANAILNTEFDNTPTGGNALLSLENDQALYQSLSETGYQIAQKYSWNKAALETIEFYDQVLSTHL